MALYVGGGIAALALVYYLLSRGTISLPAGSSDIPNVDTYNNSPPGYTVFNVQPANLSPVQPLSPLPPILPPSRCCDDRDGCFTSSPIDTGRGPLSVEQLVGWYA